MMIGQQIAEEFVKLAPGTKLPLHVGASHTMVLDDDGTTVLLVSVSLGDRAKALMFANMVVTAVNSCAGYRAKLDGSWVKE